MAHEQISHEYDPNHEQLLALAKTAIEDYTCPFTGLPTPDRQPAQVDNAIDPLTICKRSIWGVSEAGSAIQITQEYNIGNFARISDPSIILHRGVRMDLFEKGTLRPVSLLQDFATPLPGKPQFMGYSVRALKPNPDNKWALVDGDLQATTGKLNESLDASFAWFTPIDARAVLLNPDIRVFTGHEDVPPLYDFNGDSRISVLPYSLPVEGLFESGLLAAIDQNYHMPSAVRSSASRDSVEALHAAISGNAQALNQRLASQGAVDILKP